MIHKFERAISLLNESLLYLKDTSYCCDTIKEELQYLKEFLKNSEEFINSINKVREEENDKKC